MLYEIYNIKFLLIIYLQYDFYRIKKYIII